MRINKMGLLVGAAAAGAVMVVATASSGSAAQDTVFVPDDFIPDLSDTRDNGHYDVVGTGLHVWTDNPVSGSSENKVAEYWPAPGGPIPTSASMSYTNNSGVEPGMQIVFDVDNIHGNGNEWFGTLAQWEAAFASERVYAYGFSLGSGVLGDGVINSMTFGDTTYTFAEHTVLTSKEQCKKGGWATSTMPVFKNQGDCVSYFASGK